MLSIRKSLITRLLIGLGLLFLFIGLCVDYMLIAKFQREFDQVTTAKAMSLVTLTEYSDEGLEIEYTDEAMPEFSSNGSNIWYFQMWRPNKNTLQKSPSLMAENLTLPDLSVDQHASQNVALPDGTQGRQMSVAFVPPIEEDFVNTELYREMNKNTLTMPVFLSVARSRSELDASNTIVHWVLFSIGLLSTLLALFIVNRSVTRGLSPLVELQDQMESFEVNTLENRLTLNQNVSELHDTVSNFNTMMDRLQQGFLRERQFSGDVAHELRTPLAEIKSMAQVAIKWPDDVTVRRSFDRDVLKAATQMETTINNLLALARSENVVTEDNLESIDLNAVVDNAVNKYSDESKHRGLSIQKNNAEKLEILTVLPYVQLIVENLINNAIFHSTENSTISIELHNKGHQFSLSVINKTQLLARYDLENMYDRLWRKDDARTDGSHSGLGLALVKNYCRELGYEIQNDLINESLKMQLSGPLSIDV